MINVNTRKWWVLFTVCLLTAMFNFDVTAVNLAIPQISTEFHANLASMQWLINAFVLLSAMFQIIGGRVGDMWGHRRIFAIGTVIFVLASIIAGIAHDPVQLILARAGQGFALGIAYPMTIALVYDVFPQAQRAAAVGFIMGSMGIALAVGPTLGGLIVYYIGWRWIFLVNVPVGFIIILSTYIFCPPDRIIAAIKKIDYFGALILMLGMLGVVLALNQLQQWGFGLVPFWVTLIGGLLALFILYWIEKRSASPIIEFKIFSIRNYTLYTLIRIVSQLAFVPILFFVPTYLQDISGYGPIGAGLIMLYLTIVVGILAPFAGKWVGKLGARMPTTIAMFAYVLSYILLMQLTAEPNLIVLALALILIGIGTGISFVSTTTGATHPIPIEKIGEAMGIFLTIGFVSCAIGVALLGTTLAINSKSWLLAALAKGNFLLTQVQTAELVRVARGIGSVSSLKDYVPAASVTELSNMAKLAFMHGFRIAMLVFLFISIVGLILTFFTEKEKLSSMKEEEVAPLL